MSVDYIGDGDYYQGEFYVLMLTSLLGMMVMAGARDLITIFVALETISIPTFVLAGWRKHDPKSNEAAIKYYLIGVISSALMLYGMSLVFGLSGSTLLSEISKYATPAHATPLFVVAVFLTLIGFAFKISAVPFHFWAPDTYEGAPTPVTAFLSVASKAGGFVAILSIVFFGVFNAPSTWQPVLWILAAASMLLGNLAALRQTNIVRMLAYSSIAQGGFILVPFAVAPDGNAKAASIEAVIIYILIYGAMNLGAFAVVIALARRTRSAEITSFGGLGQYAPGMAVLMSVFVFSLAGIPPLAGWFAKFVMFRSVLDAGTPGALVLGLIAAVSSVIAFFYYANVAREMWFHEVPGGHRLLADAHPDRAERRDRHLCGRGVRGRRVPAALRPHRRARAEGLAPRRPGSRSRSVAAGRFRSRRSWRPRSTARRPASSAADTVPGERGATSSPARPPARSSARASRGGSTSGGTPTADRTRSSWWRPVPATVGWRARFCGPSRSARPRSTTCWSSVRTRSATRSARCSPSSLSRTRSARRHRAKRARTRPRSNAAVPSSPRWTSCLRSRSTVS